MTRYTGDAVTDEILTRLQNVCHAQPLTHPDHALTLWRVIASARDMLPVAVRRHFDWPSGWSGLGSHDRSPEAVAAWVTYALDRVEAGLEAILKDPALAASATPDLSDRPRSRGEQVEAAIERFKTERTRAAMDYLLDTLHFTPLAAQGRIVEKAYRRKGQPTLAAELHRLWSQTWSLHWMPATGQQE